MRKHGIVGVFCTLTVIAVLLVSTALPALAAVFSNTAAITIPDGQATPYPSTISVPGAGVIADVKVSITGFTHVATRDVDVLLVGPTGKNVVLMADNGSAGATGVNLTFSDAATSSLPGAAATPTVSGTYKPSNGDSFGGTPPAPAGPYGSTLSVFDGTNPSGNWNLFVFDDLGAFTGSISGGWSLDITLAAVASFSPANGEVGDTVILTGAGFTGATSVKFGGTLASTFTVDSDTQITALVPAGAGTGPIAVTAPSPLGTLTSTTDFIVHHARNASLTLNGKKAVGKVNVDDGFAKCGSSVPVKVQHLEKGKWKTVSGVLTKSDGSYKAGGLGDKGKYRTLAKKTTLSSGDVCLKDVSPIAKK